MQMIKKIAFICICLFSICSNAELVHYVELEFTQSSFTLSIRQHIRDACNSFTLTFPTTKKFYDQVKIGQEIGSKFKTASFFLGGHISNRKVVVKNKFIREE